MKTKVIEFKLNQNYETDANWKIYLLKNHSLYVFQFKKTYFKEKSYIFVKN